LQQAKALRSDGGLADIKFHPFDVTDKTSVQTLTEHLQAAHPDGIDFVINNAGIAMDGFGTSNFPISSNPTSNLKQTLTPPQTPTSSKKPSNATTTAHSPRPAHSSPSSAPPAASPTSPAPRALCQNTRPSCARASKPRKRKPTLTPSCANSRPPWTRAERRKLGSRARHML
jgi:hypothetical protein